MHVPRQLQSILISFNEDGFEPALEEMPCPFAFNIEVGGVGPI